MKIMTLGNGFVADHLPYDKILDDKISRSRIHPNEEDIDYFLSKNTPDVIINCIGKTGKPNIDWCENNQSETYISNVVLPAMIANWCYNHNVHFIHIGSGCIYFGESPHMFYGQQQVQPYAMCKVDLGWKENDFANPKSFYSKTKYACDLTIGSLPNVSILRVRMPISSKNNSRNFINKIRGYKQIIDIPNSMTMMDDLVKCIDWTAKNSKFGTYHVVNPQPITAAQVMREFKKYQPDHQFEIINEDQLDKLTAAKRSNCIINTDKLKQAGFTMSPSKEALEICMKEYIKNI